MEYTLRLFADVLDRPRVSGKVKDYVIKIFFEEVLIKCNCIKKDDKFDYAITIHFKKSDNFRIITDKSLRTSKSLKFASIFIYHPDLNKETAPFILANICFDGLGDFFQKQYKKIKQEDLDSAKTTLDETYINSFDFPALFEDQKYVGDDLEATQSYTESGGWVTEKSQKELYLEHYGK